LEIINFFSSGAAVYGTPVTVLIPENEPVKPLNLYGQSKAFIESILNNLSSSDGLT